MQLACSWHAAGLHLNSADAELTSRWLQVALVPAGTQQLLRLAAETMP